MRQTSKLGFTGSRNGMTDHQRSIVEALLLFMFLGCEFHHGDCVGADETANVLATKFGLRVVSHPPISDTYRAFCNADEVREPKDYLDRNHNIVNETSCLIATPSTMTERQRSGTWATVRYARRINRYIILVLPDGTVEHEYPWTRTDR